MVQMGDRAQFRGRILVVDKDPTFLQACSEGLGTQKYEVITASDGFEALQVLRGAAPDVIVSELDLPHMSGFELLSVVRIRFPHIAVLALSDQYTLATVPNEVICDAFIAKNNNLVFELSEQVRRLTSESPIRGSRPKTDAAPVWIPRSQAKYIILTCPECLRSFSACEPETTSGKEECLFCGATASFHMSAVELSPKATPEPAVLRSHRLRAEAREILRKSKKLREKTKRTRGKQS